MAEPVHVQPMFSSFRCCDALAGHQFDPAWQRDHLQLLAR